jgi:hypothetical protein
MTKSQLRGTPAFMITLMSTSLKAKSIGSDCDPVPQTGAFTCPRAASAQSDSDNPADCNSEVRRFYPASNSGAATMWRNLMALIACPECGNEVSDKAPACPRCGVPVFRESKVVVYGYTQQFATHPKVQVFWNGSPVGSVKRGDCISIDIDADGDISFKSSIRKASLRVQAGRVTNIKISWNRITGQLIPQIVDTVTPGA